MVEDYNLLSQFQWKDANNQTIPGKTSRNQLEFVYTESLPGGNLALLFTSLQKSMAGSYYCSATYANTQYLESTARIETYQPITWKNAPENQYPTAGSDYLVKCEVTASPNPTVDWIRNGKPVRGNQKYVIETDGLRIMNVQETDDGIYTCRAVVVETGELDERNIRIEVYKTPVITLLPLSVDAVEGQPFSVNCTATGKPIPKITWTKDSTQQNMHSADRFQVDPQTGQMFSKNIQEMDRDNYTCHAENAAGFVDKKMYLNVLVPPKITELYNQTSAVGRELSLTCRADGRPAPDITFRRWGTEVDFVAGVQPNDNRIILDQQYYEDKGQATGILRITNLTRVDDGLYQCVARNRGNEYPAFKTGHITVEYPPNFDHLKHLPPVYSWAGHKVNLSCMAQGIPNATIEWRWNGRSIKDMQDKNLQIIVAGPRSDLIVYPTSNLYYSVYKCVATNIHGIAEHDIMLREARIPETVMSATPKTVTATTVTFYLIGPGSEIGLPILAYHVQYKEEFQPDWSTAMNRSWSPKEDNLYVVEGLYPQTSYSFRFAASNLVGLSMWGGYRVQATQRRSEPEPPKFLHRIDYSKAGDAMIESKYSNYFELRWSYPVDNGEPIDHYEIKYCEQVRIDENEWIEFSDNCITRTVPSEAHSFNLNDLHVSTFYKIQLRAHNIIGYSQISEVIMKTSGDDNENYVNYQIAGVNGGANSMKAAFTCIIWIMMAAAAFNRRL